MMDTHTMDIEQARHEAREFVRADYGHAYKQVFDAYESALRERGFAVLPVDATARMLAMALPIIGQETPSATALAVAREACALLPTTKFPAQGVEQAALLFADYSAMTATFLKDKR